MTTLDDWARFHPNDRVELVAAAFACPWCLQGPNMVFLMDGDGEYSARCCCGSCDAAWTVVLTGQQFLRVSLVPTSALPVMSSPYAGPQPDWLFPVQE